MTPTKHKVSSDLHWAAWLNLIAAVFGLWLLFEIATVNTASSIDEPRYSIAQDDSLETPVSFKAPSVDSDAALQETEKRSELIGDDEVVNNRDGLSQTDGDTKPPDPLVSKKAPQPKTLVAKIDATPPVDKDVTDSSRIPAALPDQETITRTTPDPMTRYVTVWTGNIRREPDNQSVALFQLRWGQKVTVLDDQDRWYHIETSDGQRGWGHKTLFIVTPPSYETIAGLKGVVESIRVQMDGAKACTIFMALDSDLPPLTEVLEGDTPRLVSDFPRMMANPDIPRTTSYSNGVINDIQVGITTQDHLTTRVVVDLIPGVDYVVDQVFYQEEKTYALHIKAKKG